MQHSGGSKLRIPVGVILVVLVASLLDPAHAAFPKIRFFATRPSYEVGQTMKLKLKEELKRQLRVRVKDSTGTVWRKVRKSGDKQVWKATAKQPGTGVVTIRMRRSDGRVFRRSASYTVMGTPPPSLADADSGLPTPSGTMPAPMMGVSASSNDHGGQMAWESWRVYTESSLTQRANMVAPNRPLALLFSKQGSPLSGTYTQIYNTVTTDLNEFYYSSGDTPSTRWGIKVYWSNGNEMSDKGMLALPHTSTGIASFVTSQQALYDAVHQTMAGGQRRFPDAYAGSDPTNYHELQGWVADWLHPSAQYHDFVAWSIYPGGRTDTVDDPTFNWPSLNPADANVAPHGYMVRCFERVKQATLAAGKPIGSIELHVGETGTGDDPGDSTTRPYWAVYGFMHPLVTLSESYGIPVGTVNWWDNELPAGPQNILSDEPTTTSPSTRVAWQNWATYDHLRGGTLPPLWAANPKADWKHTGTQ